jgi:AraC-like DNA-binding protein
MLPDDDGSGLASRSLVSPAPAISLIRVAAMGPLLGLLCRRDARTERYLENVGMPATVLAHPNAFIPLRQLSRMMAQATVGEDRADLALVAGQEGRLDELGTYGRLAIASRTLGQAIDSAVALGPAFSSGERWRIETIDGELHLYHAFVDGVPDDEKCSEHYAMSLLVNLIRRAAGSAWRPREVHWQSGCSEAVVEHEMFRGARQKFARPEACLTIPTRLLPLPLAHVPPRVPASNVEAWHESRPPADLLGALREVIAVVMTDTGLPRIERIAAALGVSVRTLQRRLGRSGLCFEDVTKEMRLEQAVDLLARTESRILDIALDLGYSDHAHFTRAFRGWMGLSPLEYRRRHRVDAASTAGA